MKDKFDNERRQFEAKFIETIEKKIIADQRREIFMAESDLRTIRKGQINDWKSFMTHKQNQRIYQRFLEACQGIEDYIRLTDPLNK
jgi:hypothetical protein